MCHAPKTQVSNETEKLCCSLALTASVLKEMNITLQCVTCPFNPAIMLSIKRKVTYRMQVHHSDRAAPHRVDADTEY